jgi:uncharacterized protein (TIGR02594 family)
MDITPFDLAQRYIGIKDMSQQGKNHPLISWWLSLCGFDLSTPDEVPWCSAFVNGICWELRLTRSKSAAARSWLAVGTPIGLNAATVGWDVAVFSRGTNAVQGHVGFFAGYDNDGIHVLGGNQGNSVSLGLQKPDALIGIRRLQ